MNITLIGYMGSGKTTIGKLLAKRLNFDFLDLDELIEKKYQQTIPEIFKEKGEIGFRKIEKEVLEESVLLPNTILSLGGGTPVYYNNINTINESSHSVYLLTPITAIVDRLNQNKGTRPLIQHLTEENLTEYVGKHLFERRHYYEQSKTTFNTKDLAPNDIVELLIQHLQYQKIIP